MAKQADGLAIVRSMATDTANHTPPLYVQNSGFQFSGFPSVGSWISYGLGSAADNLPAYVVVPDVGGLPNGGSSIWSSGFAPARHQGVLFTGGGNPLRNLQPARMRGYELAAKMQLSVPLARFSRHGAAPAGP